MERLSRWIQAAKANERPETAKGRGLSPPALVVSPAMTRRPK
jgi:hypothetical protein